MKNRERGMTGFIECNDLSPIAPRDFIEKIVNLGSSFVPCFDGTSHNACTAPGTPVQIEIKIVG